VTTQSAEPLSPATPFHDLDAFIALPRVGGLEVSPDGTKLVTSVAALSPDRTRYVTALWQVDAAGHAPARRLTRSSRGESNAAFLPDGSLLFTSARPDTEAEPGGDGDEADERALLWLLPADGGEARVVGTRSGAVEGFAVARDSGDVVLSSSVFGRSGPSGDDDEDDTAAADADAATRKARTEAKVTAVLHDTYPVRHWDHDLGATRPRLFVGAATDLDRPSASAADDDPRLALRDLTPDAASALVEGSYDLSPDGQTVATTWTLGERGGTRTGLALIDTATGERRVVVDRSDLEEVAAPGFSPDGRDLAVLVATRTTATDPGDRYLALVDQLSGNLRSISPGWDRWPTGWAWSADGHAVFATADDDGRGPVFRIDVATGSVTRLTDDNAAYTEVCVSRDGGHLYALRTSYLSPPHPVRIDPAARDQTPVALPGPAPLPELPGTLTEVETEAADGMRVRAWLALPVEADEQHPAPLLLWIHGGPTTSWNAWSWRWSPWLMVAQGYGVLLPDPALSTGYGRGFVRRGWGRWGDAPFTDLMAITNEAEARADIDQTRTAAMGGSFGGYMANWVAGHTDRFDAIVTHASLWALDQFARTTDHADFWLRELTPQMVAEYSPHHYVESIVTPMLVIHGDKDYRVPIGEGLRLWRDLAEQSGSDDGTMPHRFLYFPEENHWVLGPQHAKIWYQTVLAFLGVHVLGQTWQTPELLG